MRYEEAQFARRPKSRGAAASRLRGINVRYGLHIAQCADRSENLCLTGVNRATVTLAMALRKMKLGDWLKACRSNALGDGFNDLTGPVASMAAERLDVTKQRVHQMVQDDLLDAVSVTAPNGTITVTFITENSLNRYLAKRAPAIHGGFTTLRANKAS
jgi:hypothetical protein